MKKGFSALAVSALMTFLIALIAVAIFVPIIHGDTINPYPPTEESPIDDNICKTKVDCDANVKGSECIRIWPEDTGSFCGCITNDNCQTTVKVTRSGLCESNNVCQIPY